MEKGIRHVVPGDAEAIRDIYSHYILHTTATFEIAVPTAEEMRERIAGSSATHPYLVYEEAGEVLGYAYAYRQMKREAYRFGATTAIYLRDGLRGRGIGSRLYARLLESLERQGLWNVYAVITMPNPASVRLHERFGFAETAYFKRIGYKLGRWLDVLCLAKQLREGEGEPEELLPPECPGTSGQP